MMIDYDGKLMSFCVNKLNKHAETRYGPLIFYIKNLIRNTQNTASDFG